MRAPVITNGTPRERGKGNTGGKGREGAGKEGGREGRGRAKHWRI